MEKIVYALWRKAGESPESFNRRLLEELPHRLAGLAGPLRINLRDARVAGGTSPHATALDREIDAVVQLWSDSALPLRRAPIDQAIGSFADRMAAWLVSESVPMPERPRDPAGEFAQIVFLERPDGLPLEAWRSAWQEHHTIVAIETQSTVQYVQNLVVRPLTEGARGYAAIIEEVFPLAALGDEAAFYDAVGNPARLEARKARMMASCATFIDFARFECFPTSQHDFHAPR